METLLRRFLALPISDFRSGEYVKGLVFGGLDGIITAFASVSAVVGANYTTGVIFVLVSVSARLP